jgi:hypothetical protein
MVQISPRQIQSILKEKKTPQPDTTRQEREKEKTEQPPAASPHLNQLTP